MKPIFNFENSKQYVYLNQNLSLIQEQSQEHNELYAEKCKVCGDKATGFHYGAKTCEPCKMFFKRNVDNFRKFVCQYGKTCEMNPTHRKRCQYCRWHSCVNAGMSFDAIKHGRKPKSEKQDLILTLNENSTILKLSKSYLNETMNPILTSENNLEHSNTPSNLIHNLFINSYPDYIKQYSNVLNSINNDVSLQPINYDLSENVVWECFVKTVKDYTKSTVLFIRRIPGMEKLNNQDLTNIINKRVFNTFGMRTHRFVINDEFYFSIAENIRFSKFWMYKVFGEQIAKIVFDYHKDLEDLNLTDKELALLVPIMLTSPESSNLDQQTIQDLNSFYLNLFYNELKLNKRDLSFVLKLNQILDILPGLNRMVVELKIKKN